MTDNPVVPVNFRPRYFCPIHGPTNQVVSIEGGADAKVWCLACTAELLPIYTNPVFRMDEIAS